MRDGYVYLPARSYWKQRLMVARLTRILSYCYPVHYQVVIGHRDKELTNLGAYFTDVVGVLFKHHVLQMCSSSTFAYQVVEHLGEVNQKRGPIF